MHTPAATSPIPPPTAGREPAPDWAETYFRALAESRQKALAALAAGQKLPTIARQRFTDPTFAQREAEILETLADLLESEAVRRATARGPIKKVCSDSLLSRLLQIFHPRWSVVQKVALLQRAPRHCRPSHPVKVRGEFDFRTATQRHEFRQWEREEAIALALRLFHADFAALPPCPIPFGRRVSHRTIIKQRQQSAAVAAAPPAFNFSNTEDQGGEVARRPEPRSGSQEPLPINRTSPQPFPQLHPLAFPAPKAERPQVGATFLPPSASQRLPRPPQTPSPRPHPHPAPACPPSLGRRLLFGLAMPPDSKTGIKPSPGFIPYLIKVGAIRPPGAINYPADPSISPCDRPSDSS